MGNLYKTYFDLTFRYILERNIKIGDSGKIVVQNIYQWGFQKQNQQVHWYNILDNKGKRNQSLVRAWWFLAAPCSWAPPGQLRAARGGLRAQHFHLTFRTQVEQNAQVEPLKNGQRWKRRGIGIVQGKKKKRKLYSLNIFHFEIKMV